MTTPRNDALAVVGITGLRRHVADVRRAVDFHCGALGFELSAPAPRAGGASVTLGGVRFELVPRHAGPATPPAVAPDPRFQHAAIAVADMGATIERLLASGATPISEGGPQHLPANTGGVTAFKFRDPDGHPLELIAFPPGVGDPRWQRRPDARLTLGIDHFALVVSDVERSIAFYSAQFGFRVVSRGVNRGAEQNRLDGLAGVEVDVIALAPGSGAQTPHLELLGYRQPPFTGAPVLPSPADGDVVLLRTLGTAAQRHDPDGHRLLAAAEAAAPLWNNAAP